MSLEHSGKESCIEAITQIKQSERECFLLRKAILLILVLILIPLFAFAETIDVQTKGVDDGVKTTKQAKHGNIIGRDGDFILHRTGIVFDKKSNLEWYAGPDINTTWDEAKSWAESLSIDGSGWRMPTIKELRTLYKQDAGTRNMTPLLKVTGWWIWSVETKDSSSAWLYSFKLGKEYLFQRSSSFNFRALAVRSRH